MQRIPVLCVAIALIVISLSGSMFSMPSAHATTTDKFFTNATTTGSCATLCKGLTQTSGSASTATVIAAAVQGTVPALDSGASSDKTGTWSAGTTISVTTWATAQTPDTVLVIVASSKTTTPIQTAPTTLPSGMTCDAAARKEAAGTAALGLSEWACHTTSTVASTTITCNLSATPTWGICEVIAINGAEDSTGTWGPFDKQTGTTVAFPCAGQRNSGSGTAAPSTATGPAVNCSTAGAVTSLNANDFWIGIEECGATCTNPNTGGNLGAVAATFIHSTISTGVLSIERRASSATTSAATCATFGTADGRWNIFCDALQAKPTYYKVEPETSATLSGTPVTTANGFSGTGWIAATDGIITGLKDIPTGTWQFDEKNGAGSITGAPVARYFVTIWQCTSTAATTCTFVGKNWDTATNMVSATAQTARVFTSASITTTTWNAGSQFLVIEAWVAWQYSGSTSSTTVTFTTIDTSMDFIPPGLDYQCACAASVTEKMTFKYDYINVAGTAAEETGTYIVGTATAFTIAAKASITEAMSKIAKAGFIKGLAISITLVMSSLITSTQKSSGNLNLVCDHGATLTNCRVAGTAAVTISSAESGFWTSTGITCTLKTAGTSTCTVARAISITIANVLTEKIQYLKAVTASVGQSVSMTSLATIIFFHGKNIISCLSHGSITCEYDLTLYEVPSSSSVILSEKVGYIRAETISVTLDAAVTERLQYLRAFTASIGVSNALTKLDAYFRTLVASIDINAGFAESTCPTTFCENIISSIDIASALAESTGRVISLAESVSISSVLSQLMNYFRTETASVTLSMVNAHPANHVYSLSGSIDISNVLTEQLQYFRTETASVAILTTLTKTVSYFKSLPGSIGVNTIVSKIFGVQRDVSGSVGVDVSALEIHGANRDLPGSIDTKPILSRICVIGDVQECPTGGGGNSSLAKAALALAIIAIGLVAYLIYRQSGGRRKGGRHGRYA